jgi:CheY-like chemotaxis protein
MQCLEKFNVTLHRHLSVEEFLRTHPILLHLADEADMSVTDYVADGFLPEMQPGEPYGDWVVRQVLDVLSEMLRLEGHCVVTADNGLMALERMRQKIFDLVIADIIMPEKEGLETISDIRKQDATLPIIAISEVKEIVPPRLKRAHAHTPADADDFEPETPGAH